MQMTIFYDFFVYLRYRRLAPGNQYLNYIRIMAKVYGAVTIDGQRCKGCDLCVVACPTDVLLLQPKEVNDRGLRRKSGSLHWLCGMCHCLS